MDSTCLNIEKAYLILNAQPTEASYGDLYNVNKGDISTKDVSVTFNAFVIDGKIPNKIALAYMRSMVNTGSFAKGKINTNSYEMDWSISGIKGRRVNSSHINLQKNSKTKSFEFTPFSVGSGIVDISEALGKTKDATYENYSTYPGAGI